MLIACPDCGTIVDLAPLEPGMLAACPRCTHSLERTAGRSLDAGLACAASTLILLFPANLLPLMRLSVLGAERQSELGSGIVVLWQQGWVLVALPLALFGVVLPFLRFGLLTAVLGALRLQVRPAWLGRGFRYATALDLWAMPDVFLIGCTIGFARIAALLSVEIGSGGWCFIAAALMSMVTHAAVDRRSVWRRIGPTSDAVTRPVLSCTCCDLVLPLASEGGRCPRCGARLSARKPDAGLRAAALVAAGYILYLPANLYPMSIDLQLGSVNRHTIYNGIEELLHAHLWRLAALIFITSIAIPLLKLVGLTSFLLSARRGSATRLVTRTRSIASSTRSAAGPASTSSPSSPSRRSCSSAVPSQCRRRRARWRF